MVRRDPHTVLGVAPGATQATIKAAWRRLAREHHPDLAAGAVERRAATRRMAEINAAYRGAPRRVVGGAPPGRPARGPATPADDPSGPAGGAGRQQPSGPPPPPRPDR